MSSKTKIALLGAAVLCILLGLGYLLSTSLQENSGDRMRRLPDHEFENWEAEGSPEDSNRAMDLFDEDVTLSYDQLMEMARTGRIRLVSELWRLRRKCPAQMDHNECNRLLRQYILEKFPEPDNKKLAALFVKYLKYEEEMASVPPPKNLGLEERYAWIRKKRREMFGEDDAHLLFGYEETRHDFQKKLAKFKEETKGMSGDKRMALYEKLRRESYGDYYDAMREREPKFSTFSMEMDLRSDELNKLPPEKKARATRELRVKYFGEAGAKRMAAVDAMLAKEAEAEARLPKLEADFKANNPNLTGDALEAALLKLREKELESKEAAEAYTRRIKLKQSK